MNLLIDTHLVLWAAFAPDRLPGAARRMMEDPHAELWFSVASIWEVVVKRALDRPDFRVEAPVLRGGLISAGWKELAIEGRHCLALATLPSVHADPFDRMLVAQAASEGLMLLTSDGKVAQYDGPIRKV